MDISSNKRFSENAIIIIGNGFDITHGLKTSYGSFANYLIEKIFFKDDFKDLAKGNNYEITSKYVNQQAFEYIKNRSKEIYSSFLSEVRDDYGKFIDDLLFFHINNKGDSDLLKKRVFQFQNAKRILKNELLGKLYSDSIDLNWFNIEKVFFDLLNSKKKSDITGVKKLNDELQEIKDELIEYLQQIVPTTDVEIKSMFESNFRGKKNLYFLNFNYTKTIYKYNDSFDSSNTWYEVNNIHGELSDTDSIIFGYGDDTSDDYSALKNLDIDEFVKHFKTRYYFLDDKYSNLIAKLEEFNEYEVYVIGHSLGRTDKTLLKEIMDSKKCLRIHLFKREFSDEIKNKNSYSSLTNNILRLFDSDREARKKIVNFLHISKLKIDPEISEKSLKEYYINIYGKEITDKIFFKVGVL